MVTAIITTYGRSAEVVEKALLSVLRQSYSVQEVIIVDDNEYGSRLSDPIRELCDKHDVTYIKQNGNKGACAARNLGIANSKGDYIAFLDDDDEWLPDKIEAQMKAFKANDESVGLVFCSGIQINDETSEESEYYNYSLKKDITFAEELGCDYVGSTSNPLIRRKCFETVGGFWEELPARQDYEMWLRIASKYRIIGLEGKYFIYTIHAGDQITKDKAKAYIGFRSVYRRYKNDYAEHPEARLNILNWIIWNRSGHMMEVLRFIIEREWVCLRYGIKRK